MPQKPESKFQILFAVALVAANGLAFIPASLDKSWGALGIAVLVNPVMNGLFALGGCVSLFWLKRRNTQMSVARHLGIVLGASALAVVALFFAVMALEPHGC